MGKGHTRVDIRPAEKADYKLALVMNEGALPHVSSLTEAGFAELAGQCFYFGGAWVEGAVAGFLMALRPGEAYQSLNYRWFCERYTSFVYIDRIVVAPQFNGMGIGRALYADVERAAKSLAPILTCEVNLKPPNPGSLAFHKKLGFAEVGQLVADEGKLVSLMVKAVGGNKY